MSVVTIATLKTYFQTGDFPTQTEFENLIDTLENSSTSTYKRYVALLTQSGTNAPVATIQENTLGGTIVWTYTASGDYLGTLTNAFTSNKSFSLGMMQTVGGATVRIYGVTFLSTSTVQLYSTSGNDILSNTSIEIRVYP